MKVFWIKVLFYPTNIVLRVLTQILTSQFNYDWYLPIETSKWYHMWNTSKCNFYIFSKKYTKEVYQHIEKLKQAVLFYTCQGRNKIIIVSRTKSSFLLYLDHFHIFKNVVACGLYLLALSTISKLLHCCKRVNIIQ